LEESNEAVAERVAALEAVGLLVGDRLVQKVDADDLVGLTGVVGDLRGFTTTLSGRSMSGL
jgi:hypothetical protein